MNVNIEMQGINLIMLDNYIKKPNILANLLFNIEYNHLFKGDSYGGPGSVDQTLKTIVRKLCVFRIDRTKDNKTTMDQSEVKTVNNRLVLDRIESCRSKKSQDLFSIENDQSN